MLHWGPWVCTSAAMAAAAHSVPRAARIASRLIDPASSTVGGGRNQPGGPSSREKIRPRSGPRKGRRVAALASGLALRFAPRPARPIPSVALGPRGRGSSPRRPRARSSDSMNGPLLEALRERVLVFDGAMGTQIQARSLAPKDFGGPRWEGCNDYLSLTRPDVIESIHSAYFEAGADVVETNSFQASRPRLEEWGLEDHTPAINRAAAQIAR